MTRSVLLALTIALLSGSIAQAQAPAQSGTETLAEKEVPPTVTARMRCKSPSGPMTQRAFSGGFVFAVIAADGMPPRETLVQVVFAMLGGQIAVGVVNELVDAETDAGVKPWKPIPAGEVTIRGARILLAASLVVMAVAGSLLGWAALLLCAFGNGIGIAYSLWFKRTLLAWLPYLIALPLLPIWVFVAVDTFDSRLLVLYPLGPFAGIGVHLAQSLPDVEADRASGVRNLTSALGETRAFVLAHAFVGISVVLAGAAALLWIDVPGVVYVAAAVVVLPEPPLKLTTDRTCICSPAPR